MAKEVIKRNLVVVDFNSDKIYQALEKGFRAAKIEEGIEEVFNEVIIKIDNYDVIKVEEIQDIVERVLSDRQPDVLEKYHIHRAQRKKARDNFFKRQSTLARTLEGFSFNSEDDSKRENANVDGQSSMGLMLQFGSTISKEFTKSYLMEQRFADAHDSGDIHIHDMDFYPMGTTTCLQIPLQKIFEKGFNTGHGTIREPQSITSYSSLAAIAIQANQNDQHGGQSVPTFDFDLAPGVIKSFKKEYLRQVKLLHEYGLIDNAEEISNQIRELSELESVNSNKLMIQAFELALVETEKLTLQAMEAFVHNLNTMHSRAGAQVPFSSINFGTDTSKSGRMVTKNLLLAMENGLGNGETPIFPICVFKIKEGVNYLPSDPNYDLFQLSLRVTSKRMFPNFSFIDSSFNIPYYKEGRPETEATYMGCRTRVVGNVDKENEIVTGRGNLSFTSINLVRLGIKHRSNIDGFFSELEEKMDLVKDQLLVRMGYQMQKQVENFPFLMGEGLWLGSDKLKKGDYVKSVLRHGTLSIGFIGLAEALVALIGKHHGEDEEALELAERIIGFMRARCDSYMSKYDLNFSLIGTPAEGLSGRFINIDKKEYGIIDGVTNRDFYTNSFHVPVYYNISISEKLGIEGRFHKYCNAGHISYVELTGDSSKNLKALERVVKLMRQSDIGYGAINHPIDRDPICGYNGIIDDECPKCGRQEGEVKFDRIRRITGYLVGTLDRFNNAKRAEEKNRVKHG